MTSNKPSREQLEKLAELARDPRWWIDYSERLRTQVTELELENKLYRLIIGDIREAMKRQPPEEIRLQVLNNILGAGYGSHHGDADRD